MYDFSWVLYLEQCLTWHSLSDQGEGTHWWELNLEPLVYALPNMLLVHPKYGHSSLFNNNIEPEISHKESCCNGPKKLKLGYTHSPCTEGNNDLNLVSALFFRRYLITQSIIFLEMMMLNYWWIKTSSQDKYCLAFNQLFALHHIWYRANGQYETCSGQYSMVAKRVDRLGYIFSPFIRIHSIITICHESDDWFTKADEKSS